MKPELNDEHYAQLAQGGDERAFNTLFTRHWSLVRGVIAKRLSPSDAEEVAQLVFLEAWRKINDYNPDLGPFLGWIVSVAKRRAIDFARRGISRANAYDGYEQSLNHKPTHNGHALPEVEIFDTAAKFKDRLPLIKEAMCAIPPLQAQVLRLMLDGLSQRAIAEQLDTPLGTIKTRMELGIAAVQNTLRGRGYLRSVTEAETTIQ